MPDPTDTLTRLRALIAESGLSQIDFARRVLAGRDSRSLRRYLDGGTLPDGLTKWVASVVRVEVEGDRVTVTEARFPP